MLCFRRLLVAALIGGFITGCQSGSSITIAEYRPRSMVVESKAPDSQVIQLVRWTPIAPLALPVPSSSAVEKPATQMPVEVEQVYVQRGSAVGFRRVDNQLVAVAGVCSENLVESHYEWKTLRGQPGDHQTPGRRLGAVVDAALTVIGATAVVVLFLYVGSKEKDDCN